MIQGYERHLADLSRRYGVSVDRIEQRVNARRRRVRGLIGPRLLAHSVGVSLAIGAFEERLACRLAAGARHVCGLDEAQALDVASQEVAQGHLTTLGYWAQPGEPAASIARRYRCAIEAVAAYRIGASVSIKADLLGYDPALVGEVLRAATDCGVRVHFDGQGHDTVTPTHDLVEQAVMSGADVSATLTSRFQRSVQDAERMVRLRVPVRVVKGQGGDPQHPKRDPRAGFLEVVEVLAGRAQHVGIATHDRGVAEPALDRLQAAATPCSLEQLWSLPRLDVLARQRGVAARIYVAYGHAGLPYAIGEVLRRPAIVGWLLRDLLVRHRPA